MTVTDTATGSQILQRAAAKLRETAEEVVSREDLDWIALVSPAVVEPLATWLEAVAAPLVDLGAEDQAAIFGSPRQTAHYALPVAHAILGES